jgi:serine/threonine-protein kinase RsbW
VTTEDEVRLTVPATPEFLRLARVTAAGLASRLGFTLDQVEDLRLAIDELCFTLTGPHGRDGVVQLSYILRDDALEVRGEGQFQAASAPAVALELSELILTALVDEHQVSSHDGRPGFRLVKRRSANGSSAPGSRPSGAAPSG